MAEPDYSDFVKTYTNPGRPALVPELVIRLATELIPLWETTERIREPGGPPPYWAFAWPGGQALARYILDNPCIVRGKSVVDFGAGSGLVGIAAAKSGASVLAADIDPFSLAATSRNAAANGVVVALTGDDIIGRDGGWDTVCLGDMCYERPLAERVLPWLHTLTRRGALVLLGDPGRSYFPHSGMRRLATYGIETSRDLEDREMRETSVYELVAG